MQRRRLGSWQWTSIEDFEIPAADPSPFDIAEADQARALMRDIIDRLDPPDRQIMLLYLEGIAGSEIGEITGVSTDVVATKIHRFKAMLTRRFSMKGETQ